MPPIPAPRRRRAILLAASLACLAPAIALAQPVCRGTDILPELASSQPALHAQLLDVVRTEPNSEALLWRITGQDDTVSWLFGTIHLTDSRVHALTSSVEAALGAIQTLALEIDDLSPKAMQKAFAENASLLKARAGQHLDRLLSASEKSSLGAAAQGIGVPAKAALTLRPWFLTMLLSRPACEAARQDADLLPLDTALRNKARARGAKTVGLETIADQLKAMGHLTPATELAWLRSSLLLYPRIDDLTETLVQLYLARRISATWALAQGLSGPAAMTPAQLAEIQFALVVHRNRRMAQASLPLLKSGRVMIAVGALHLPGRAGLVQLLREAGYTVSAVE